MTGQFLSIDPEVSTTNQPYVYTGDNPVNASDPTGLNLVLSDSSVRCDFLGKAMNGTSSVASALDKAGIAGSIGVFIAYVFEAWTLMGVEIR